MKRVQTVTLPMQEVTLSIPIDSLRKLPQGATYSARNGRASAQVSYRHDTLLVSSISDSIQSCVEYNERLVAKWQQIREDLQQMARQQEQKQQHRPLFTVALASFLGGVFIGILLTIIVKLKIKRV